MENVILVTFEEPRAAYQAMSELRRLNDTGAVPVRSAAIVERRADGSFHVPEDADNVGFTGTAAGGAVGALIGALAGPLGLLLGGMAGVAVGSAVDVEQADTSDALVSTVASRVPPGATALVADVDEPAPEVLGSVMLSIGGTLIRWPREQVEEELAAGADAVEAAEKEARRVMRERRRAEGRETLGDKAAALKDRLTRE